MPPRTHAVRVRGWLAAAGVLAAAAAQAAPGRTFLAQSHSDLLGALLRQLPFLDEVKLLDEPLWKYVASLVYIGLAFYSSKWMDWLVSGRLKKWSGKTSTQFNTLLLDLVHGPIKVVSFVIFLHIGLRLFNWTPWVQDYLSKGLRIAVAWSLTYMVLKAVDVVLGYWRQQAGTERDRAFDEQLFQILRKFLKVFIGVVAVLLTAQNLGLNITSVLASLSIGGLALGLAAQDTLANLFGAVSIFLDRPFHIGDRIKLEGVDGMVEAIGLRSTRVRNLDGHLITIPNKTMGAATITNVSQRPNIKTEINLGLTYDTTPAKLRQALGILEEVYRRHPQTKDLLISFNRFADSALNIQVVHWYDSTDYPAYLAAMQELNLQVKQRFDEAGIGFAFPSQTVYLKQDSAWRVGQG